MVSETVVVDTLIQVMLGLWDDGFREIIIRRVADPGDYHRGLTNALKMDKAPSHQAVDLMTIMPHVDATGILVHTPVTHGHIITVVATGKEKITKEMALQAFLKHPRIRVAL